MSKIVLVEQASAPDTPGAGRASIFINADKRLAWRDDTGAIRVSPTAYAEGTWTPVLTGSSSNPTPTYSVQSGRWTRIGNTVTVQFVVAWSALAGGSGDARFSLPFVSAGISAVGAEFPVRASGITFTGYMVFEPVEGQAFGRLLKTSSATGPGVVPISDLGSSSHVFISGTYFV